MVKGSRVDELNQQCIFVLSNIRLYATRVTSLVLLTFFQKISLVDLKEVKVIETKKMLYFTSSVYDAKLNNPFIANLFLNDVNLNEVLLPIDSFLLLPNLSFAHSIDIFLTLFRSLSGWRKDFFFAFELAKIRLFFY